MERAGATAIRNGQERIDLSGLDDAAVWRGITPDADRMGRLRPLGTCPHPAVASAMPRLPLAPPMLPDEALSSWLARIAARYDLHADALVRHLLTNAANATAMVGCLDYQTVAPLEAALAAMAGQPVAGFAAHRLTGLVDHPRTAWPRTKPAWCPLCVAQDVAAFGEVYGRVAWLLGGVLLCTAHQCLLIAECPRCFHQAEISADERAATDLVRALRGRRYSALKPNRIRSGRTAPRSSDGAA